MSNHFFEDDDPAQDPGEFGRQLAIWILIAIILFIVAGAFFGCYSEQKAVKQVERALDNYPGVTIAAIRDDYPCVPEDTIVKLIHTDSSAFISSRDSAIDEANKSSYTVQQLVQRLKLMDQAVQETCGDYAVIIDTLNAENKRLNAIIKKGLKPVVQYKDLIVPWKDEGEIFLANQERDKYKQLYAIDHDWRITRQQKDDGKILIRIPYWIILVLCAMGLLTFYTWFKTGGVNPIHLLKKSRS